MIYLNWFSKSNFWNVNNILTSYKTAGRLRLLNNVGWPIVFISCGMHISFFEQIVFCFSILCYRFRCTGCYECLGLVWWLYFFKIFLFFQEKNDLTFLENKNPLEKWCCQTNPYKGHFDNKILSPTTCNNAVICVLFVVLYICDINYAVVWKCN